MTPMRVADLDSLDKLDSPDGSPGVQTTVVRTVAGL
ncbi:hypothetical protein Bresu_1925 [Brevundimonas subvibrioides ATCC 15264]|uniref:Uncharacterized protein n=1 Tax=Brevundimonas subvibrioides (strain ATCC 15264 / DSM 4735 / LMG 14903 / NBRC 16000 / CB 81) TaxID=633149 RepID=D9QHX8_BRESC|nr:hypothetical protein Bresu_1925 [Brevundimonas subvibrioides ATCC 15264]